MLIPVILSGGSGTRMWPLSRAAYPKQFLALAGEKTMLQQTALRIQDMPDLVAPIIISNAEQRFVVAEQLRAINVKPSSILLEPVGRNTAPAVAVAAVAALRLDPNAVLLVWPSDHVILDEDKLRCYVERAAQLAKDDYLVTFGIKPVSPHTGYGYIRRGKGLADGAYEVEAFVEKPDHKTAETFLADGGYYWNSGIFVLKASVYLEELAIHQPAMLEQARLAVKYAKEDLDFVRLDEAAFSVCPSESIDYAVMEHTSRAAVVEAADLGWSDVGSWSALSEVVARDESGNTLTGDVLVEDVRDCYIRAESRMVAAIGVENLVIVETADATLVTTKDRTQDVKKIVERLNAEGRGESVFHRRVLRPWGSYEGIDAGERFQVKRIVVNPGAALSLQMHYHRAEHWIVVKGTARVVNGERDILLGENQSTYIPLGERHRLENPGKVPLELIEVQSGSYLGEDDIVRFDDQYGRTK
ncbi:mannose-1-phosphate guanylyltransferase/mannose-6-phosphate isomerase [Zoogloea sp.]|uniref:mannose-1-phosphate guanylyltransferase/mannose-6-phosphate isomerase n=1 Tax=Zoogloea sp. TaxID=49181 RepID=UPI00263A0012|nr:mannose-1-phosphate guanylyltransferase/mannose-6-phosphate isomerase [Zoogloea sp.]MDD3352765.1 mannose-1-phosphate guanylyltransferase/mannose-6-phosphate isomerase [Zoogloea sp.]